jgi:hypothetical protein
MFRTPVYVQYVVKKIGEERRMKGRKEGAKKEKKNSIEILWFVLRTSRQFFKEAKPFA